MNYAILIFLTSQRHFLLLAFLITAFIILKSFSYSRRRKQAALKIQGLLLCLQV